MRLTKTHTRKKDTDDQSAKLDLDLLADFLNFPYDGLGERPFKQKDPLSRLKGLHPFGEDFEFDLAWKDSKAVAELQAEILQVLDPLIGRRLKNKWLVKYHLEKLVAKINSLDLRFGWIVVPADEERRVPYLDPKTRKPVPNTERKIPSPWKDSGHAIFEIWGTKWIVTKSIVKQWSSNIQSAQKLLFSIVVTNLENRQLSHLKRCGWCRKFFVTPDGRSNYCTADHRKLNARREAKINMQQRRANEKKQKEEDRRDAEKKARRRDKELKLLPPFKSLLKRKTLPVPWVSKVKEWKANGRQAEEILENLSEAELRKLERVLSGQSR
jgi:hypothetical protein